MIPLCSRFDSVLFTPKMSAIASYGDFSRSPKEEMKAMIALYDRKWPGLLMAPQYNRFPPSRRRNQCLLAPLCYLEHLVLIVRSVVPLTSADDIQLRKFGIR